MPLVPMLRRAVFLAACSLAPLVLAQVGDPLPVGHWTFDSCSGGVAPDQASPPHDAQLSGGVFCAPGQLGDAAHFDGYDGLIEVPGSSDNPATFAVAAWVRPAADASGAVMNRWYAMDVWGLWYSGGQYIFAVSFPGGPWGEAIAVSAPAPAEQWVHVAGVYDGAQIALYLDGQLADARPASGLPQWSDRPIVIGNHPSWEAFEGAIDDARSYDVALDAAAVARLASGSGGGDPTSYEAEAPGNTLIGGASIDPYGCAACSGGALVRSIGPGGMLTFNDVQVAAAGRYVLDVDWIGDNRYVWVSVNGMAPVEVPFNDGDWYVVSARSLRVDLSAGSNTISFSNPYGWAPDIDRIRLTGLGRDRVTLADVPAGGPAVWGAAVTHEHVMSELAFSGKWFWGTVEGPEQSALGSCDGNGTTHAGAYLACDPLGYLGGLFGRAPDSLGRDTCCHSGGALDCYFKRTDGHTGDPYRDYLEWPKWDTNAHPRYWHGYLQRALDNGLRLLVAHAVENYPLCTLVRDGVSAHPLRGAGFACDPGDSYRSIERQIDFLKQLASNHANFLEIAYSAADARRIIASGKLALVIGVETDYAWGHERSPADTPQVRLDLYHQMGARTAFLAHSLNTPLAGTALYVKIFRAQQSFMNCFFLDRQCTDGDPNVPSHPGHPYQVPQTCITPGPYASNYGELCALTLIPRVADSQNPVVHWDGMRHYPGGGVYSAGDSRYNGTSLTVEKNELGLTADGRQVVDRMMDKGMLVEIGHISERAIDGVYDLSSRRYGYPLISSHSYARRIARHVDGDDSATWEGKLGDATLERIAETEGFAGHFTGGDDALDYPPSGVANNCARSTRSLAQSAAYVADKVGLRVTWAGDFQGLGQGVAPRRGFTNDDDEWCRNDSAQQAAQGPRVEEHLSSYSTIPDKERAYFDTRGYAHHGLIGALHDDLAAIGWPARYLQAFRDQSAETFLRTWEKSEYIARLPKPVN